MILYCVIFPFLELSWNLLLLFHEVNVGRKTDQDRARWARASGVSGVKVKQTQVFVNCVYYFVYFINTDWRKALLKIHSVRTHLRCPLERVDARSRFQIDTAEWFNGVFLCIKLTHDFKNEIRPWTYKQILA